MVRPRRMPAGTAGIRHGGESARSRRPFMKGFDLGRPHCRMMETVTLAFQNRAMGCVEDSTRGRLPEGDGNVAGVLDGTSQPKWGRSIRMNTIGCEGSPTRIA